MNHVMSAVNSPLKQMKTASIYSLVGIVVFGCERSHHFGIVERRARKFRSLVAARMIAVVAQMRRRRRQD